MSQRRMTSLDIIDTDAFLDMPQSSQLLYFHLNARADDDGFIANPKRIMRDIGSQIDDMKLLISKKFLIAFEDGVIVIKHWRINNYIRKDIYKETKYIDHKQTLFIRPNGAYTLTADGRAMQVPKGHFQLNEVIVKNGLPEPQNHVHEAFTERALRLGKVRLGKDSINTREQVARDEKQSKYNPLGSELIKSFETINPACRKMYGNTTQREACDNLISEYSFDRVKTIIEKTLPKTNTMDFFPNITTPDQLWKKWASLEAAVLKHKGKEIKNNNVAFS